MCLQLLNTKIQVKIISILVISDGESKRISH